MIGDLDTIKMPCPTCGTPTEFLHCMTVQITKADARINAFYYFCRPCRDRTFQRIQQITPWKQEAAA